MLSDRFSRCATGLVASAALVLGMLGFSATPAHASASVSSPCIPTEEQLATYEADGTLDERMAHAEELDLGSPSESLIAQAKAREAGISAQANFVPVSWRGGMPTEGEAHVIALYVDFPAGENESAYTFGEEDTLEALDALIDGRGGFYPYEDLSS